MDRNRVICRKMPTKITTPTKRCTASRDPEKPAATPTRSCRDLHSFREEGLSIPIGRPFITTLVTTLVTTLDPGFEETRGRCKAQMAEIKTAMVRDVAP